MKERFGTGLRETKPYGRNEVRKFGCVLLRDRSHKTFKEVGDWIGINVQAVHKFYNKISEDDKEIILKKFDSW